MRSRNEVLCAAAGRLAAERSDYENDFDFALSRLVFSQIVFS
jgi:hypothetical protein